jgi:tRNA G46 methylase TrmB
MGTITKIPDPYDPCYCQSGRKYKFCHYQLDKLSGPERFKAALQMYLEGWKTNAEHFQNQNCYDWMASQLRPFQPKQILDIGCGDGAGIIALATVLEGSRILSLDDNSSCLNLAKERCESIGLNPDLINRFSVSTNGQKHQIATIQNRLRFESRITLIEGDILWDDELLNFMQALPKFDAITVWLMGTYAIKIDCANIARLRAFSEVGKYRRIVNQRAYQLGDKILKPGGLIHIVNRGIATDRINFKELTINEHSELSAGTTLKMLHFEMRDYKEAADNTRITMENRLLENSVIDNKTPLALSSVISIKS